MNRLRFLAESKAEVREAAAWYEEQRPGLASSFLDHLDEALGQIAVAPLSLPLHRALSKKLSVRRAFLSRFPYEVVFQVRKDQITIIAVAHSSRRPAYWTGRLPQP